MNEQQEQTIQSLLHTLRETHRTLDQVWPKAVRLGNELAQERMYTSYLEAELRKEKEYAAHLIDLIEDQKVTTKGATT